MITSGGVEGEAPNNRRGGSCPTVSLLALPVSSSSTTLHLGLPPLGALRSLDGRGFLHGHFRPRRTVLGRTPVTKIQLLRSTHVSSDRCAIESRASSSAGSLQAQKKQVTWR